MFFYFFMELSEILNDGKSMEGISRIKGGWYARIYGTSRVFGLKVLASETFNDKKYGGIENSIESAKEYVRRGKNLKQELKLEGNYPIKERKNNISEEEGVFIRAYKETSGNITFRAVGFYCENGKKREKSFAFGKWGEKIAKIKAKEFSKGGRLNLKISYLNSTEIFKKRLDILSK